MIKLTDVTFRYENKEESLKNCNLHIKQGEFILLCGKSGCGKTTLTKLMNGLIPKQISGHLKGDIVINGTIIETQELWEISQHVGSVFQNPKTQFFNLDTTSELAFGLENKGIPREKIANRLQEVVKEYQLEKLINKSFFELSGGEKPKIVIASAYMENPEVYVFNELSANLGQQEILRLRLLLTKLKEQGKTIIIAEHRVNYLSDLRNRIIFLENVEVQTEWYNQEFLKLDTELRIAKGIRSIKPVILNNSVKKEFVINEELSIANLRMQRHEKILVDNLSFQVSKGEISVVYGKNGTEKNTLTHILCGLRKFKKRNILFSGKKITSKQLRKKSFLVMQDVNHQLFLDSVLHEAMLGNDVSI